MFLRFLFVLVCVYGDDAWVSWGNGLNNTRCAFTESVVSPDNVANLEIKWIYEASGSISATPTVIGDDVYITDWNGTLSCVSLETGQGKWTVEVGDLTGIPDDVSRSSPHILGDTIFIGSALNPIIVAVNRFNGALIWSQTIAEQRCAKITQSPIYANGMLYVGVSSNSRGPSVCPGARGSVVAMDPVNGRIIWVTYTIGDQDPADPATGASVWGRDLSFDLARNLVFVPTGQPYVLPESAYECERQRGPNDGTCVPDDVLSNCIIAMDMSTGEIRWVSRLIDYDAWNGACVSEDTDYEIECPEIDGPDYDLGQGAIVFDIVNEDGETIEVIGAGQKSGDFWLLNREDGSIIWKRNCGVGGITGGLEFGSAYDGKAIYVSNANSERNPFRLKKHGNSEIRGSHFAAINPQNGDLIWETPAPIQGFEGWAIGAVSAANGVVYGGTTAGDMNAFDAATGEILWNYTCDGSIVNGPAVVNGVVLWGCGFKRDNSGFRPYTQSRRLIAFHVPPKSV